MAEWAWMLADSGGANLAELSAATGRSVAYQRNSFAEAQCSLAHDEEAAELLLAALATGIPTLKAYRRGDGETVGTLRFHGYLAPFAEAADESARLSLVFRSPFARLLGDGSSRGRFTDDFDPHVGVDAGAIAQALLEDANAAGATGLGIGTVQSTVTRDRTYRFANVGEAIVGLSRVINGFDFDETFIEGAGTLAELNIYASLGDPKPGARFEYGPTTIANVRSVARQTQPPINRAVVLGANGLYGVAENAASIATYGLWVLQEAASDVSEQATLDAKAESLLRPNPVKTVEFTPAFGLVSCPRPWEDFWLGDTVPFLARRDSLIEDASVRVNAIKVVIDDDGQETYETASPGVPEDEPDVARDEVVRAQVAVEITEPTE